MTIFMDDWHMVLAPAIQHCWRKQLEEMLNILGTSENPERHEKNNVVILRVSSVRQSEKC